MGAIPLLVYMVDGLLAATSAAGLLYLCYSRV